MPQEMYNPTQAQIQATPYTSAPYAPIKSHGNARDYVATLVKTGYTKIV